MEQMSLSKYFGGTNCTLQKLIQFQPKWSMDGTRMLMMDYLKECKIIDELIPNKSKIWVPYLGAQKYGILKSTEWTKHKVINYYKEEDLDNEKRDWWWMDNPIMNVLLLDDDGVEHIYHVYEYSFYNRMPLKYRLWKEKGPKRKFLSQSDIAKIKKNESIINSVNKRK
jgi:hypothetical protein